MKSLFGFAAASLSASLLTACSSGTASTTAPLSELPAQLQAAQPRSATKTSGPTLYVAEDGGVGVYGGGGASLLRKLRPKSGLIATDPVGYLYLGISSTATVKVFSNQGATLVQKFHVRGGPGGGLRPGTMVSDGSGDLYVFCGHSVCEYRVGSQQPIRTIRPEGSPYYMTTDPAGNLYVGINYNDIVVYAPGSTSPQRTITNGIAGPEALACDSLGDLYVANTNAGSNYIPNIVVYESGSGSPERTISSGVKDPHMLAVDGANNLLVLNQPTESSGPNVTVYAQGSSSPLQVVNHDLDFPNWIAIDSKNQLYVANIGQTFSDSGSVSVYAAGTYSLIRSVTHDIRKPSAITLGS